MPRTWTELGVLLAATVLCVGLLGGFRTGPPSNVLSPDRASWRLTPGVANPDVTQDNIGETICTKGWTRTIRPPTDYTNELKAQQMVEYHRAGSMSDYQEDHLISLEVGGHPTDPRNLWPQPIDRAVQVDGLENELNHQICSGQVTLREGQQRESNLKHTAG